ncbi:hypothetical protein INR49_031090 [Caranx melampygus]|nr:hypothetical protein INR49_031090 [Caranx melampygus]
MDVTDRSGRTPLHHAAHSGHGEMVNLLLSKGANASAKDKKERQAIHWAAHPVMKLLVSHSADVASKDKRGYTPLHAAAAVGTQTLMSAHMFGNTALHMACHTGQDTVATDCERRRQHQPTTTRATHRCTWLLPPPAASVSRAALNTGPMSTCRTKKERALFILLLCMAFTGSQILIQNGGDRLYGQELLISTLLTNGADKARQGIHGMLPLHLAALYGFSRLLSEVSLQHHVVSNFSNRNIDCLTLLLNSGAELGIKDQLGRSPLHYAAANGNSQCTIALVSRS